MSQAAFMLRAEAFFSMLLRLWSMLFYAAALDRCRRSRKFSQHRTLSRADAALFRLLVVIISAKKRWIMNQNSAIMGLSLALSAPNNNCISIQRRFLITFLTIIIFLLSYYPTICRNVSTAQFFLLNASEPSARISTIENFLSNSFVWSLLSLYVPGETFFREFCRALLCKSRTTTNNGHIRFGSDEETTFLVGY